jgi:hypothetical protein
MPNDRLTTSEVAILVTLMAEAREIANPELKRQYGLTLDGQARRKLNDMKLVESTKRGSAFAHQLTDRGWARCREELAAPCPPRAGSAGGALYALLGGLGRYLEYADLSLSDVFRPELSRSDDGTQGASVESLEAAIRSAYKKLAKRPGAWVSLGDLRPQLGQASRSDVDAALLRMSRGETVRLVPENVQGSLTARDRAGAIRLFGRDLHFIAIEDA